MKIDQTNHENFPKIKYTPTSLAQMWENESQHMTFCSFFQALGPFIGSFLKLLGYNSSP
jgi:hypothetical protein